jgi:hypothetical protein
MRCALFQPPRRDPSPSHAALHHQARAKTVGGVEVSAPAPRVPVPPLPSPPFSYEVSTDTERPAAPGLRLSAVSPFPSSVPPFLSLPLRGTEDARRTALHVHTYIHPSRMTQVIAKPCHCNARRERGSAVPVIGPADRLPSLCLGSQHLPGKSKPKETHGLLDAPQSGLLLSCMANVQVQASLHLSPTGHPLTTHHGRRRARCRTTPPVDTDALSQKASLLRRVELTLCYQPPAGNCLVDSIPRREDPGGICRRCRKEECRMSVKPVLVAEGYVCSHAPRSQVLE